MAFKYYDMSYTPTDITIVNDGYYGVVVTVQENGVQITGVQFYRRAGSNANAIVRVYASNGTTLLASGSTVITATAGWYEVPLSAPLALTNGTTYVVAFFASGVFPSRLAPGGWPRTAGSLATSGTTTPGRPASVSGSGSTPSLTSANEYFVGPILESTLDTTGPTVPAGLTATPDYSTVMDLAWTASTDAVGVTGYKVERKTGAGAFAEIATPTATSYHDTGLEPATAYVYRVRATDLAANLSGYSSEVTATTGWYPDPATADWVPIYTPGAP